MKTFEDIYTEVIKGNGINTEKILAKAMFEAGQKFHISEWLNEITDFNDCLQLTQFVLIKLSKEAINMNAGEVALSTVINHNNCKYKIRLAIQYSKEGEKSLPEMAYEIVDRMLSNGAENCDIREELKKAVLAGYNLHREDFDE